MSLLQMSIYGAVLILAVVVIRVVAINRLPKKIFLVLWGLVLLRLLIPFSIPSVFSVYSLIGRNTEVNHLGQTTISDLAPIIQGEPLELAGKTASMPAIHVSLWFVIWLVGMILCTMFFAISYLRCCFEFSTSLPIQNDFVKRWLEEHKLIRSVSIRQSDRIFAPLTYGIMKPIILIPQTTDWKNAKQLQYIFLHEYVHICRFDTVTKLISTFALCVHWFNPLVWIMYILYNRDIELACDESVVRLLGETSRKDYSLMLISMEAKKSGLLPFCNNFSKNAIEERITAIMKMKKTTIGLIIGSLILIIVMSLLFVTSTQKKQMIFVSGRLFVTTNQDVSEMVMREAEASEYDSPYIGRIESTVSRGKEPDVELQSNFGSIGSEIIFNGNGVAVNLNGKWIQFEPQAEREEDIAAFVKKVSADSITVDMIEYITDTDTERIKELKLTEDDMLDGYYFFNPDEEVTIWKCNEETVYTFIDWGGDFTDGEFPVEYTTTDIKEFQKYIETYDNGEPGMPFFFMIKNGYIKQMIEKPFA